MLIKSVGTVPYFPLSEIMAKPKALICQTAFLLICSRSPTRTEIVFYDLITSILNTWSLPISDTIRALTPFRPYRPLSTYCHYWRTERSSYSPKTAFSCLRGFSCFWNCFDVFSLCWFFLNSAFIALTMLPLQSVTQCTFSNAKCIFNFIFWFWSSSAAFWFNTVPSPLLATSFHTSGPRFPICPSS